MKIEMKKFGELLNGRPAGREAALRLFQIVNGSRDDDEIILDFEDVKILTPSFADEFLNIIKERYSRTKKIQIKNTETTVVKETLKAINQLAIK